MRGESGPTGLVGPKGQRLRAATLAAALALAGALLLGGCGPLGGVIGGPKPPNVILIVTDDQTVADTEHMPNVRRLLAEEGTTFENAFVTDPLCCPARATILRGQYAHNHGVTGNAPPRGGHERFRELGREDSTVATWLEGGGYRTAFFGKYLNGYAGTHVPPGWGEWNAISGGHLSDDLSENGRVVSYDPARHHLDDVLAEKAVDYVERSAREGSPFLAWVGTKSPHLPATPAPRHRGDFAGVALPQGPSFDERDVSDKPAWIRDNPPLEKEDISRMEKLHERRLESLQAVDEMVARLVGALRQSGQLDDTYIFFMSDNGFHAGEHRLDTGKWTAYEEDVRVPLIVRGPGVGRGEVRKELVLDNDLAPTIAQLAGVSAPPFVDGRSLVGLLEGEAPGGEEPWRQAFLIEAASEKPWTDGPPYPDQSARGVPVSGDPAPQEKDPSAGWGRPALEAVRTEDHLYVEYENGDRELYDLKRDPHQLRNLLASEGGGADPREARTLGERLSALKGCAGASCRAAEEGPAAP